MSKRWVVLWFVAVAVIAGLIVVARRAGAPGRAPAATPTAAGAAGSPGTASTPDADAATTAPPDARSAAATRPTTATVSGAAAPAEAAVTPIALAAPLDVAEAEVSGLAWYADTLVFLPQYPGRFGADGGVITDTRRGDGLLFGVRRADVEGALDDAAPAVTAFAIPLAGAGFGEGEPRAIDGFEGFEAIAFRDRRAYLSIEVQRGDDMAAYLVAGRVDVDADGVPVGIALDDAPPVPVPLPVAIDNMSFESLFADGDGVTALFEANGAAVNPTPRALRFGADLAPRGEVPFPALEYRVTDAADLGADGGLWVMNYMFPGDAEALRPGVDAVAERWGEGPTHGGSDVVERLLRLEVGADAIALADAPPIALALRDDGTARNWEGLVELGDRGFLLVTDRFPGTELAFVPRP